MSYCAFKDCYNKLLPLKSLPFFALPTDKRRTTWIKNSGNLDLKNISEKSRKFFCVQHFAPKYLRKQFNRTLLTRDAIPYNYYDESENEEEEPPLTKPEDRNTKTDELEKELSMPSTSSYIPLENNDQCDTTILDLDEVDIEYYHTETDNESSTENFQVEKVNNPILPTSNYSGDEHFLLSLVDIMGRFPQDKKTLVKFKILQLLTELEESYC